MINNLFRGKRCKDQEWVYGYLVESHRSWRGHKPHKSWIVDSPITNGGWFALMGKSAVIDDTVGAYTGLKDENGTMVFTGDVINDKNGIDYIVRYNKEKACFAAYNGQIEVALFKVCGWKDLIQKGFQECFRVLQDGGFLIFKWNETDIKVSDIISLSPYEPVFGHISGKRANTHWFCFIKDDNHAKQR